MIQGTASSGRPTRGFCYSRAAIQAEAGVGPRELARARRVGAVVENSPYSVAAYVADQRGDELAARGVDVDALKKGLAELQALSGERAGIVELD